MPLKVAQLEVSEEQKNNFIAVSPFECNINKGSFFKVTALHRSSVQMCNGEFAGGEETVHLTVNT